MSKRCNQLIARTWTATLLLLGAIMLTLLLHGPI